MEVLKLKSFIHRNEKFCMHAYTHVHMHMYIKTCDTAYIKCPQSPGYVLIIELAKILCCT